jgi:hypothetical protein
MEQILIPTSAWSEKEVVLNGVPLILEFTYNNRAGWHLSISDISGDPLLTGVKLTENRAIDLRYRALLSDRIKLEGGLYFVRVGNEEKPTRDNIQDEFALVFITDEEILNGTIV